MRIFIETGNKHFWVRTLKVVKVAGRNNMADQYTHEMSRECGI